MKQIITSIFLVASCLSFGQGNSNGNANPNNNANGTALKWDRQGNSVDTSDFIGTTNERSLKFKTNNSEHLRITPDGKIGIGTIHPEERLDIHGNVIIRNGDLNLKTLEASDIEYDGVLMIDSTGKVKNGGDLKRVLYTDYMLEERGCSDGNFGYTTPSRPIWFNGPGKLYTSKGCVPDIKVGIGIDDPLSKLHIKLNGNTNTHALIVENGKNEKLLQLNKDGLLQAREIKVDQARWPDYVFTKEYQLMTLEEVKAFIEENGHLPNVPPATEVEEEGLNLGENAKITMEKLEELTLYLIQMKEQLDEQLKLIEYQRLLLEKQQKELEDMKTTK